MHSVVLVVKIFID